MPPDENKGAEAPNKGEAGSGGTDEIKNLKSEFNRKMDNLAEANKQLLTQLNNISKQFTPPKQEKKPESKRISVYDDEEAYAAQIKKEARDEALAEVNKIHQSQAKYQQTIAALVKDFPELNDGEHQLTKRAVEIFNGMAEDEKASVVAYRTAVKEAALELDLKPKSKRKDDDDDAFTMATSRGGDRSRGEKKSKELDARTRDFAELMGVDPDKVKARIEKRKSFGKWE